MLRSRPFDLVLLDIVMPLADGFQVLAAMKDDPALRHVPVIVISAVEDMESVVRCIEMGAEDYLPKPFDPALLRARINAGLAKKRLARPPAGVPRAGRSGGRRRHRGGGRALRPGVRSTPSAGAPTPSASWPGCSPGWPATSRSGRTGSGSRCGSCPSRSTTAAAPGGRPRSPSPSTS